MYIYICNIGHPELGTAVQCRSRTCRGLFAETVDAAMLGSRLKAVSNSTVPTKEIPTQTRISQNRMFASVDRLIG